MSPSVIQVQHALEQLAVKHLPIGRFTQAAVLVPLLETARGLEIVFTVRQGSLTHHRGQVAFPGGRRDAADGCNWDTALREAEEEIGTDPRQITRLGRLSDFTSITQFHIAPMVGLLPKNALLTPNESEVAHVFTAPIRDLLDERNRRTALIQRFHDLERIYFYDVAPDLIWGATGGMLMEFLEQIRMTCP